jgi:integrase
MILLGVNCGFGNADCGTLPQSALDLERGWVNYPRPKTGIERRAPLWPETVQAIREALAWRPEPKDPADAGLVFVTKYGLRWFKGTTTNPLSAEMRKLLAAVGIRRPGVNFYALRHVFETVGGEARDQVAVDCMMGHARDDMASVYREKVGDDRLKAVADHVRGWLFGEPATPSVE